MWKEMEIQFFQCKFLQWALFEICRHHFPITPAQKGRELSHAFTSELSTVANNGARQARSRLNKKLIAIKAFFVLIGIRFSSAGEQNGMLMVLGAVFFCLCLVFYFSEMTVACPHGKNWHRLSERLASLGIMGDQLRATLRPLNSIGLWWFEGCQSGPQLSPWYREMPVSRTCNRCCFSSQVTCERSHSIYNWENKNLFPIMRIFKH